MRIGINLTQFNHSGFSSGGKGFKGGATGGSTYAAGLLKGLSVYGKEHEFFLFSNPDSVAGWSQEVGDAMEVVEFRHPALNPRSPVQIARRLLFDFGGVGAGRLRTKLEDLRLDVLHFPADRVSPYKLRIPLVLSFFGANYWLLPAENFNQPNRLTRKLSMMSMARSLRASQAILVPSTFVANCLVQMVGISSALVHVCRLTSFVASIGSEKSDEGILVVRKKYDLNEPFFFYPAGGVSYKNHARLFEALELLKKRYQKPVSLVITCARTEGLEAMVRRFGVERNVRFLTGVPRCDLANLYASAVATVHPSLYEAGASFSMMEAMYCGCPVLFSRLGSMLEIMEGAGLPFDPYQPEDISESMFQVLTDPQLKQALTDGGYRRVERSSFEGVIGKVLCAYRQAADWRSE